MPIPADHPVLTRRPFSHGELIADGVVHAAALIAGVIAFAVLFVRVAALGDLGVGLAMGVYAAGFFLLFGFSCAYNMTPPSTAKWLLRRLDHSSIYLMIAGTYTAAAAPIADRALALPLIAAVWAGALAGVGLKLFAPGRWDRLSIVLYLGLGWTGIVAFRPLMDALPPLTLGLLLAGGIAYSLGVIFYLWRNLKFHNAIWHALVAFAAALHYVGIAHALGRVP